MESHCCHGDNIGFEDDILLLDDENTNECSQCNKKQHNRNGDVKTNSSSNWLQINNGMITGVMQTGRLSINSDHLDSPEDSPLLNSERHNVFGNLSIGEFHCHSNFKRYEDNKAIKRLIAVSVLCFLFMVTELTGGYIAGSLAVMTDAAHLFSDLIGFCISILSIWIGKKQPTRKMTFGYHRTEILGAFISILAIWVMAGTFFMFAIARLVKAEYDINANMMLLISLIGLVINIFMGAILHGVCHTHSHSLSHYSEEENINVRAASAHIIGDIFQSVGVLSAAAIIKLFPNAKEADPICTILFCIIVVCTTLSVAKDSFLILIEASPVNVGDLMFVLRNIQGVKHVHSLHLWTLAPDRHVFSAHLAVDESCDRDVVLNQATHIVSKRLKVISCHIQVEAYDHQLISNCTQCQELQY